MSSTTRTILMHYGGAVIFTALAVLVRSLLDPVVGDYLPLATLYGAVAFVAWLGGYRPALLTVVLGYLACDYLFIEPRGQVLVLDARNLIGLMLYLFSCAVIIGFGEAVRSGRRRLAGEKEKAQESEAAHRAAMQQLQIVTESMAALITRCSRDLTYLWVSKPYADWIGRLPDKIIGCPIADIVGSQAFTQLRPHFEKALAGQVVRYEEQVHFQGIGPRWINAVYTPTLDATGTADGWVAVVLDITERRQMEEALRQSEERFARFMEQLPGLAWIKDLQGRYIYANDAAVKVFCRTRDGLYGKTDDEVFSPETAAEFKQNDRKALVSETGVQVIETLQQEDGIVHHSLVSKFPILGPEGSPALIGGMAIDITDRLKAEAVRAEFEGRFRQLAENINEVFWMTDPQTTQILYISPAYERVWGRSCQSLYEQPRSFLDGVHPDDRERVQAVIVAKHGRGEATDEAYRVVRPDGSVRWVRNRAFPIRDAAGQVYRMAGIAEDTTDTVLAEVASREANAILRSFYDTAPMMMGVVEVGEDDIVHLTDNTATAQFFARSPEALHRQAASQLGVPAATIREWIEHYRESERTGRPVRFEYTHQTPEGTRWLSATVCCIERLAEGRMRCSYVVEDITERRQAGEEIVRLNQELASRVDEMQAILDVVPVGIGIAHDPACRCISHNPYLSEILGVPGWRNASLTASPDERPDTYRVCRNGKEVAPNQLPMQVACTGVEVRDFEVDVLRRDGGSRKLLCHVRPLLDGSGRVRGSVGAFLDITSRRQMEEALRQSEAQFRQLADAMPQIVWAARPDGYLDYYNERWYEYTGFPRGEYGQQSWEPILHPDDVQRCVDTYFGCIQAEKPYQIEYRFKDRQTDGYRWFLARAMPVRDESGKIIRWFGTCTDIDDTKRAEQQLASQSQRLREVAAASSMVHSATTTDSVLQIATEQARRIIGTHQAVSSLTINQQWAQAINARSLSDKYARWQSYDAKPDGSGIYSVVCRSNRPLRLSLAELEAHPEFHSFGKEAGKHPPLRGWLAVPFVGRDGGNLGLIQLSDKVDGSDFTAEDEAVLVQLATIASVAIENAELYEGLRQADRRKDEFLATLAHELRNPLAPLRHCIELLGCANGNADLIRQASRMMERQLGQMVRLVDDLLDISRITRGKVQLRKEHVELATLVHSAVEGCRPLIEAQSHQLTVTLPPDPIYLDADLTRLSQVLANLLNNAAKYTKKGGHIWLTSERQGNEAVVSVRDTGIGIAADYLPHLFEMFSQAAPALERSQGGLGIGLALVRGLVELHGGTIEARSGGPGLGSEFIVRLPVAQ